MSWLCWYELCVAMDIILSWIVWTCLFCIGLERWDEIYSNNYMARGNGSDWYMGRVHPTWVSIWASTNMYRKERLASPYLAFHCTSFIISELMSTPFVTLWLMNFRLMLMICTIGVLLLGYGLRALWTIRLGKYMCRL